MRIRSENELIQELINRSFITQENAQAIFDNQNKMKTNIIDTIVGIRALSADRLLPIIAELFTIAYLPTITNIHLTDAMLSKVPAKLASRYTVFPINLSKNTLKLCISDPLNMHLIDDLKTVFDCTVEFVLSSKREIKNAINTYYGVGAGTIESLAEKQKLPTTVTKADYERIDDIAGESSIVTFVNKILANAHQSRATDIHIEPYAHDVMIRYRIDGVLHDIKVPHHVKQYQESLISRIKILANLDISEHRLPQDGRIKIKTQKDTLDLRVSIMPTAFGESVNIRLLSSTELLDLAQLGFNEKNQNIISSLIVKSHGIVFLTGPTGSGKTTTLYSCLNKMKKRDKKIITIEDPIEYQLEGVTQIQVHPKIGLTFGKGLRSMLRHDPDVIMVGEVRDGETAEIAIRSSLTGHLVFSTLHTNDAPSAITRLLDMGVEPYLISSSIEAVIAQRLVRKLCSQCKKEKPLSGKEYKLFAERGEEGNRSIFVAQGCLECSQTGYINRIAIVEIMLVNDEIRELITNRASHVAIKDAAHRFGMQTLREDGWEKVLAGATSIDEVIRATQED